MKHWITAVFLMMMAAASAAFPGYAAAQNDTLAAAYKKEFAFLEAEKKSLLKRLSEQDAVAEAKIGEAKNELGSLSSKLLHFTVEASRMEELLLDSEREAEGLIENADTLEGTVTQAAQTLETYGVILPETGGDEGNSQAIKKQLAFLYQQSLSTLGLLSSVRTDDGEFFLKDGKKASGKIIRLGNVAALGSSPQGGGALAPAGDGRFKIWQAGKVAESLTEPGRPRTLKMFIYESLDKAVDRREKATVIDTINLGGVIGWIIVILGVGAALMILMRSRFLYQAASRRDAILDEVTPLVTQGKFTEAENICKAGKGATARVLKATIRNLNRDREHLEDIISESILHETPFLDRFGASILVFAAVAPLLGLLGTVTGMISTFNIITEFGAGDPKLLSGGISEALITTELGLIVAIPTLLCGNLLSGWSEKIKTSMENAALKITNLSFNRRQASLFDTEKSG